MVNLVKNAPQIPAVLAFLVLWASFVWGLPAEEPVTDLDAVGLTSATWTCGGCDAVNDTSAKYCKGCGAGRVSEAGASELLALGICTQCGFETEADAKFCPECGKRFKAVGEDTWAGVSISNAYSYAECPHCRFKNVLFAESCSRCSYALPQPSSDVTDPHMVFVPGRGYFPRGTLLEPPKTRKGLWVPGLVLTISGPVLMFSGFFVYDWGWLLFWPGLIATAAGVPLLVVGLVSRTEPVYAFASGGRFGSYERQAFALRSPGAGDAALKIEATLYSF